MAGYKEHDTQLERLGRVVWIVLLVALGVTSKASALDLEMSLLETPVAVDRSKRSDTPGTEELAIRLGEPISFRLVLANDTQSAVELIPTIHPGFQLVRLYRVDPDGTETLVTTVRWEVMEVYVPAEPFAPGASVVHEDFLFARLEAPGESPGSVYAFPEPGAYQLYARYQYPPGGIDVQSDPVIVRVGQPLVGWDDLLEAGIIDFMEGRSRSAEEVQERRARIETLLEERGHEMFDAWIVDPVEPIDPAGQGELIEPVAPSDQAQIEEVLSDFLAAFEAQDVARCVALLSGGFRYNGALDREGFREELLASVREHSELRVSSERVVMTRRPEGVEVSVDLSIESEADGGRAMDTFSASLVFTQREGSWLIESWNRE